jgi:1,4-alpha-glucan branching enzyme
MKRLVFLILITLNVFYSTAQVTTNPELPTASQSVTITFNSAEESWLGYYTGDLYAHTGVIIQGDSGWKHVIGDWGNENNQPKLTHLGNGVYELEITPDINTFYSVPENEAVVQLAFVFRTADESKQTDNIFISVYGDGLVVEITEPSNTSVLPKNESVTISAASSLESDLKLYLNETLLTQTTGKNISTSYTFTESGNNLLIAEATAGDETVTDSISVFIREDVVEDAKPAEYKKGINYPTDTSAALVLWAPYKDFVFVLGDFNNWQPDNNYQMKKDGDVFWLEIPNLEKGKEYIFQYFIDGEIKIADPYTEKTIDPWNDPYIEEATYPDLIEYPAGKTEGTASVLQPGQEEYNWEATNFQIPDKNKMVIYELLVRDFTEEHTYKAVREKLDYLEDLNINVLELMPVNEFEGNSSWGYNPSFYFAPDKYYGPKNELKKLIDECHKRGIAVVIDMVLNHSYGQSPFVQMYMDNWTVTAENPWYNISSPNQTYSWGYDFNHEAAATQELVDSVNSFWLNEYHVDGFRFDFTKGFTNTSGDGWAYDASRIAILKRMADEIRKEKEDALIILEHLTTNQEEKELAGYGMLLWGNMSGSYSEAAKGNTGGSDLSNAVYSNRGWNKPNLVSYPESHDEERVMVNCLNSGYANGDYNIKDTSVALTRIGLNAVFHLLLPGPKMIWQFGERGYDLPINTCEDGSVNNDCRTSPKPPHWDYLDNSDRTGVFRVMAKLNYLKQTCEEFSSDNFEYSLSGAVKWIQFTEGDNHVFAMGNFGTQEISINFNFPETGKWYRFFEEDSIELATAGQLLDLTAGEYRIYSTRQFNQPEIVTSTTEKNIQTNNILIYPNPANHEINIQAGDLFSEIEIYSLTGKLMYKTVSPPEKQKTINIEHLQPGIYLLRMVRDENIFTQKIVVN